MTAIAFVTSAWGSRFGGINSFNADLCRATARARPDLTVYCVTSGATQPEVRDALTEGVQLVGLGEQTDGPLGEIFGWALSSWASQVRDLSWWIGHDIISGPAVVFAAERTGVRSAIVQHTDYASYGALKGTSGALLLARDALERRTLSRADVLFGVGPKLARAALDRVQTGRGKAQVQALVPGLPSIEPTSAVPHTFRAITFGRLADAMDRIKQGKLAVHSFGRLVHEVPDIVGADPRITVVGLAEEQLDADQAELARIAGEAAGRALAVIGHPFTDDRETLFHALRTASVSLMLSVHEGFGLTGWEAIAAEIPLIITKNSGLYELLESNGGPALGCVHAIDVQGWHAPPYYSPADVLAVTAALRDIAVDRGRAKRDAQTLRQIVARYDWDSSALTFLDALGLAHRESEMRIERKRADSRPNTLPQGHLPARRQEDLVGRSEVLNDLSRLLEDDHCRFVTVIGPPGTGKTRVVTEIAHRLRTAFDDRVYFVDLENVADPELVTASVTRALKMEPRDPIMDALTDFFRWNPALLVLDNFEQVVSAALSLRDLSASAPLLQVLITSREPLKVAGEVEFRLDPLADDDAVDLFLTQQGSAGTSDQDREALKTLCASLDNLPLAIELIAAHAGLFAPDEMAQLVKKALLDVAADRRDVADRQRSLRRAMDWSYDLLTAGQSDAFERLSVFADGFSLTSASAIVAGTDGVDAGLAATIAALFDKSLVKRAPGGRLSMLGTVRTYAAERLATQPSKQSEAEAAHARFFLRDIEAKVPLPLSRSRLADMDSLTADSENYDKALRWLLRFGRPGEALRMAARLGRLWWETDLIRGVTRLDKCLTTNVEGITSTERTYALIWHGRILLRLGRLSGSSDSFERAAGAAEGDADEALRSIVRADLALVLLELGESVRARQMLEASTPYYRASDDPEVLADVLDTLGIIAVNDAKWQEAADFFDESADLYDQSDNSVGVAWVNSDRAAMALAREEYDRASELAEAVVKVAREDRNRPLECWADLRLGVALCCQGKLDESLTPLLRAMNTARLLGDRRLIILVLEGCAMLRGARGQDSQIITLAEVADQLRTRTGIQKNELEARLLNPFLEAARSRLGASAVDAARRYGRKLTLERAIALAETA